MKNQERCSQSLCPVCGEPNACQLASADCHKGACWCMEIAVPVERLRQIAEQFGSGACLCRNCLKAVARGPGGPTIPGRDCYLSPEGYLVFTAEYLLRRGTCCGNGCRHCPYPNP